MSDLKKNGKVYKKRGMVYKETIYGSFVDYGMFPGGMEAQKNAMSEKQLIKYRYKKVK